MIAEEGEAKMQELTVPRQIGRANPGNHGPAASCSGGRSWECTLTPAMQCKAPQRHQGDAGASPVP